MRRMYLPVIAALAILAIVPPALAAEAGRVLRMVGKVEVVRPLGATPLFIGSPLEMGDRIRTGDDARVQIELEGGALLTLGPDSELVVPEQAARNVSVVDLLLGIVRAAMPREGSVGGFLVRGRTAVASVRSTEWIVETDDDNTAVFAISGSVQVTGTGGSVVLEPGQGTDVAARDAPTEPKEWGHERRSDAVFRTDFP